MPTCIFYENGLRAATRLSWKSLPARVSVTLCHHRRRERTEGVLESLRGAAVNPGRSVTLADEIGGEVRRGDAHAAAEGWGVGGGAGGESQ